MNARELIPTNRLTTHPGRILFNKYLKPIDLSQVELAKQLDISAQRINDLVNGRPGNYRRNSHPFRRSI